MNFDYDNCIDCYMTMISMQNDRFIISQFVFIIFCLCGKERKKEMFYLTTHSIHFYLQLYGDGHMVKDE